ncbi:MAG: branched-chain-amino-acid transaminase, partial [Gammaproteobacteria bacterium]
MSIAWSRGGAFGPADLVPTGPLPLHPGAHVLHYASACFEGLKGFKWADGQLRLFRLDYHVARMRASAEVLRLPVPPAALLRDMIVNVARAATAETPQPPGALYLRPTLIGTEANVGAAGSASKEACLYVLGSPVGDYFGGGLEPLKVLVETEVPRTTPSFGRTKCGANYVLALSHTENARAEHGVDTVLFCPGGDVQETGASNFLLINDDEVLTKPLTDAYLHGATRDSVLHLAADLGYEVSERDYSVDEMLEWARTGEAALSGTAAVLSGVGALVYQGATYP